MVTLNIRRFVTVDSQIILGHGLYEHTALKLTRTEGSWQMSGWRCRLIAEVLSLISSHDYSSRNVHVLKVHVLVLSET